MVAISESNYMMLIKFYGLTCGQQMENRKSCKGQEPQKLHYYAVRYENLSVLHLIN